MESSGKKGTVPHAIMKKVVVDTSMLLSIEENKVDFFEQARHLLGKTEFYVTEQVLEELEKLGAKNSKRASVAVAKKLLEHNNVKVWKVEARNADEAIEMLANKAIIATNDAKLRKNALKRGGRVMFLRKKQFIEMS